MKTDPSCDEKSEKHKSLVAALPEMTNLESATKSLLKRPPSRENIVQIQGEERLFYIKSIPFYFHYPVEEDVQVAMEIDFHLRVGYNYRNSLHLECGHDGDYIGPRAGFIVITGISGLGKTANINLVLQHYEQVIEHPVPNGKSFKQLVWIKLNCLSGWKNPNIELCIQFMNKFDGAMDTHFAEKSCIHKSGLQSEVMRLINDCSLGMLVVDDLQNLVRQNCNKGLVSVLDFLIEINENCGVPIVLIGTPDVLQPMSNIFRILNKLSGSCIVYNRIKEDSQSWKGLMEYLWKIQYTNSLTEKSDAIYKLFYNLSQGIPSVLVNLFVNAQLVAIMEGKQAFDESDVDYVSKNGMCLVQHAINAIKCNHESVLQKYTDLLSGTVTDFTTDFSIHQEVSIPTAGPSKKDTLIAGVITALIMFGLSFEQAKDYTIRAIAELGKEHEGSLLPSAVSNMAYDMYKADQASGKESQFNATANSDHPENCQSFIANSLADGEAI